MAAASMGISEVASAAASVSTLALALVAVLAFDLDVLLVCAKLFVFSAGFSSAGASAGVVTSYCISATRDLTRSSVNFYCILMALTPSKAMMANLISLIPM